jgi:hypothetical protein
VKRFVILSCLSLVLASCSATTSGPSAPVRPKYVAAREQALAPRAIVSTPPPPAPAEVARPPGPGGSSIWREGHYQFRAGRYEWIPGAWVVPPRAGLEWFPGFFERTPEGGVFINGHWRPAKS